MTKGQEELMQGLLDEISDMKLEASPCSSCGYSVLLWGDRYCTFCGEENENFNPDFEIKIECPKEHPDIGSAESQPYCGQCGQLVTKTDQ